MAISKAIPSGRGGCIRIRRELCGCVSIDSRLRFCKVVVSCLLYLLLSMSIPSSSSRIHASTNCKKFQIKLVLSSSPTIYHALLLWPLVLSLILCRHLDVDCI